LKFLTPPTPYDEVVGVQEVVAKRLELLRELVPAATRITVLVNPANATSTESTLRDVAAAARTMGLQIQIFNASTSREIVETKVLEGVVNSG
jgi:ABC-type uncharacterized transport system substrate-binding protein